MKSNIKWVVLGLSVVGMGISMPSCPGEQELKQQVDTLQTANADLNKKVHMLTTQVTTLNGDVSQIKQLLPQITNVVQAQKGALDQLDAAIRDMQPKGKAKKKGH